MAMRRGDKEIVDSAELNELLDRALVARFGFVNGDRPYVVPLNFAREHDVVWFHCATTGLKLDCLRASPHVCIEIDDLTGIMMGPSACDDWSCRYTSVIGFGTAEIVVDEVEKRRGLAALMGKYSGRADWEFSADRLRATVVVRLRLDSLTGKRSPAG